MNMLGGDSRNCFFGKVKFYSARPLNMILVNRVYFPVFKVSVIDLLARMQVFPGREHVKNQSKLMGTQWHN